MFSSGNGDHIRVPWSCFILIYVIHTKLEVHDGCDCEVGLFWTCNSYFCNSHISSRMFRSGGGGGLLKVFVFHFII